jgi:hypothetical protein
MGFQEEENLNAGDDLIIQIDKENTPPEHADQKLETERTVKSVPSHNSQVQIAGNEFLLSKKIETVAVVGAGPAGVSDTRLGIHLNLL